MITCNRKCGQNNLHWKIVEGKYKLFSKDNLLHMCNDGVKANKLTMRQKTDEILETLGLKHATELPTPDIPETKAKPKTETLWATDNITKNASKCFTITTTASGVAITGDDKHNPIYLPKIAIPELIKAMVDFI